MNKPCNKVHDAVNERKANIELPEEARDRKDGNIQGESAEFMKNRPEIRKICFIITQVIVYKAELVIRS